MKNKKLLISRIVMTVLTLLFIAFIFGNSLRTADASSEQSEGILEFINRILCSINADWSVDQFIVRKLAHFSEFALLGALLTATVYLYIGKRLKSALIALPVGACVGVCDELLQTVSEGRSCELRDMLIDSSGVVVGVLLASLIITLIIRLKKKRTEGIKIE